MKSVLAASLIAVTTLTTSFLAAVEVGKYWATFPYDYQRLAVLNSPFPGGHAEIQISVSRVKLCSNEFYHELYDGTGRRVMQRQWRQGAKPIGEEQYTISIPIPAEARPGDKAAYCFSQAPQCNVLQGLVPYWTQMKCYRFQIKEKSE